MKITKEEKGLVVYGLAWGPMFGALLLGAKMAPILEVGNVGPQAFLRLVVLVTAIATGGYLAMIVGLALTGVALRRFAGLEPMFLRSIPIPSTSPGLASQVLQQHKR